MAAEGISELDPNDIAGRLGQLFDPKYLEQYKINEAEVNRDSRTRVYAIGTAIAAAIAGAFSWHRGQNGLAGAGAGVAALALTQTLPSSKEAELRKKIQTDLGSVAEQLHKVTVVTAHSIAGKINAEQLRDVGQANQRAKNILLGFARSDLTSRPGDQEVSRFVRTIFQAAAAVSKLSPLGSNYHPELIATVDKIQVASKQFLNGGSPGSNVYVKNELDPTTGMVHSQPWPAAKV